MMSLPSLPQQLVARSAPLVGVAVQPRIATENHQPGGLLGIELLYRLAQEPVSRMRRPWIPCPKNVAATAVESASSPASNVR